jgi:Outer membrane protein Omp28
MRIVLAVWCALVIVVEVSPGQQRNVLVELFTNAHCPLCPPAHSTLDSYRLNDTSAAHVNFIYYHMRFPYSDDPLFVDNEADPDARNLYYGPFYDTPDMFVDGTIHGNTYSSWAGILDARTSVQSPLMISLQGGVGSESFTVGATITALKSINAGDLVLYFVVTETVNYQGRNGVSPQRFVMRKMIPDANGMPFAIDSGEVKTVSNNITLESTWISRNVSVVVFVQSASSREVYQSASISYNSIVADDVETQETLPDHYELSQNFPNPFNPSTQIDFQIPTASHVTLTVYDLLGRNVATLVDGLRGPGGYHAVFHGDGLTSGIYFYRLVAVGTTTFVSQKKFVLLK